MAKWVVLLGIALLLAGIVGLAGASLGWGDTQVCPPGFTNSPPCYEQPDPTPAYLGVAFAVAGLAVLGTSFVRDPRKPKGAAAGKASPAAPSSPEKGTPAEVASEGARPAEVEAKE